MLYEINYLVLQSKTGELEKIRNDIKELIESFEAKITAEKEYLKRKLSYEINHEQYGFFTVLRFETENSEKLQEIKKALNLDKNVDRYIIVRAEELPSLEEQAEKEVERKSTLKQEDVEKAFAEETKKTAGEDQHAEAASEETESEAAAATEEAQETPSAAEKKGDDVRKESTDDSADVDDTAKDEPETEEQKKKKDEKEKVSLDDLDKKLDEILDL